ncbi:MAG: hypothetical protein M3461_11955 [Pseudomonadota bacterium]|nr:hypothetical protein [Pseudomonadota bacterium]
MKPNDLGVVEAPNAGSTPVDLADVPPLVLHAARVAFKEYVGQAVLTGAHVDADGIEAVYEVKGRASDDTLIEADIQADAVLLELEIEISRQEVPENVHEAVRRFALGFEASGESPAIEKSIRPSAGGLPEIWYEFSGVTFDVEVRSDARAVLIEPA